MEVRIDKDTCQDEVKGPKSMDGMWRQDGEDTYSDV
jgi:hypothetical protein